MTPNDPHDRYASLDPYRPPVADLSGLDDRFVFDFSSIDLDPDETLSTYWDVEPLSRGPEPVPDWVVRDRGAIDRDLGVLKTGKEADVSLRERSGADGSVVMAAKQYRDTDHRNFHRSTTYTEGRRTRNSRDTRALAKKSDFGRQVAAGQWAYAEWEQLKRLWSLGVPVPYPVQIEGTEILMELITDLDGDPAPRLAPTRPEPALLATYFDQLRAAVLDLASAGIVHGDLSPYNVLATGERIVVIDLPQVVDLVANPQGTEFLRRDCHNVCHWFTARGLEVDEEGLFAEALAAAY